MFHATHQCKIWACFFSTRKNRDLNKIITGRWNLKNFKLTLIIIINKKKIIIDLISYSLTVAIVKSTLVKPSSTNRIEYTSRVQIKKSKFFDCKINLHCRMSLEQMYKFIDRCRTVATCRGRLRPKNDNNIVRNWNLPHRKLRVGLGRFYFIYSVA